MRNESEGRLQLEGELVAELLDQEEYPSNVGEVAAVSDLQICVLRRDWNELLHYRLEYLDIGDCRSIEYRKETAWYRIVAGGLSVAGAIVLLFLLATGVEDFSTEGPPLVLGVVMLTSLGVRFVTSTHRHLMHFEMPGEVVSWRSPPTDFDYKAPAARAVQEFARRRGILRGSAAR